MRPPFTASVHCGIDATPVHKQGLLDYTHGSEVASAPPARGLVVTE
ncbi:MAG: hypothetical protein ABN480_13320 [Dickeya sp.]